MAVNFELTILYWRVGTRIRQEISGERIVHALSGQLTLEYGKGFSQRNLFHMLRFAEIFSDPRIVQTLSAQLS